MEQFAKLYSDIGQLSDDQETLKKLNKQPLVEYLSSALKALKLADDLTKRQADTIMRSTDELLKQCELVRNGFSASSMGKPVADIPCKTTDGSFANAVKSVPAIVMKKANGSEDISREEIENKMKSALKGVRVNKTVVKNNGTMVVEVPNHESYSNAVSSLRTEFSSFSVEASKKLVPKITILNVPLYLGNDDLITEICDKDEFLKGCIDRDEEFTIINSWDVKDRVGKISSKKVAIKCSPMIRNHIINDNDGFIYLSLVRCRVFDRFYVPQCYHCQRFNHFSRECPDKRKLSICAKCTGQHDTRNCSENFSKCVNCVRNNDNEYDHASFSQNCPVLVGIRKKMMAFTDYTGVSKN